jgi:hypothetical protein
VHSPEPFECTWMSLARRNGAVNVSQRSPPCRCFKWRKTSPHAQTAGTDGFLHHTRLGLVGWITYWCLGDSALTVDIIVALIKTLGLTELVSDALTAA